MSIDDLDEPEIIYADANDAVRTAFAQRLHNEQLLRNEANALDSILGSMGAGVIVADQDGNFTYFNPAAEKTLGIGQIDAPPEDWPEQCGVFLPDTVTLCPVEQLPLVRAIRGEAV